MSALPSLTVTGSTGALGSLVAAGLADLGVEQRLLARTPARAPGLPGAAVMPFAGYADRDSAVRALAGTTTLLMVSGAEAVDRLDQHRTFVDAAVEAGVDHIVYTSFAGASADCTFTLGRDHHATEEHIRATGVAHTFLRDNFYLDFFAHLPGEDGVIRGPADDGRVAAVARADVARAAVAVLADPTSHRGRTYDLTGPTAFSLDEAARILTLALGRPIRYHPETVEEAYASRLRWEAPQWQYDAWVSTYTAIAAGEVAAISDDVRRLTGHEPLSLEVLLGGQA